MSTRQLKNRLISAEPRLVVERTSSRPGTVRIAASSGRVIDTSICSIGMNAGCVGNVANDLVRVQVDNDNVRRVRDVEPARGAVDGEIVPAAFTAEFHLADDVITGGSRSREQRYEQRGQESHDSGSLAAES